jgi:putative FmdB family regulatory protein
MALYDFACRDCGTEFEVFCTGFIKEDQKVCPQCDSTRVEQKFSSFLTGGSSGGGCAAPAGSGYG